LTDTTTLQRGDQAPRGDVTTVNGDTFSYRAIWQQKNLVLVALPEPAGESRLASELAARSADFHDLNSVCVVTRDRVQGLPAPAVLVAVRWGEVVHVAAAARVEELPAAADVLEWLDYIQRRCSG
jgi:hypothetical protein